MICRRLLPRSRVRDPLAPSLAAPDVLGLDLLIKIKPQLDDVNVGARPTLVKDLDRLSSLAEAFSELRSNDRACVPLADKLDQDGVCSHVRTGYKRGTQ